jgi:hypothetical protein
MLRAGYLLLVIFVSVEGTVAVGASPSDWSPVVIPTGAYRAQIKSLPVQERPGRPLHVYGNTVRLMEQSRSANSPVRPLRQVFIGSPTLPSVRP